MKALFIPFSPSPLSLQRCLRVAEAWQARGHQVVFACGEEGQAALQAAGFTVYTLPEIPRRQFDRRPGFLWATPGYFQRNLRAEQELIEQLQPDALVSDHRLTSPAAARQAGLPCISLQHTSTVLLGQRPDQAMRYLVFGAEQRREEPPSWRRRLLGTLFQATLSLPMLPLRYFLRRWGFRPAFSLLGLMLGDRVIVDDLLSLLPGELPPNCYAVGPLLLPRSPRQALAGDLPTVAVVDSAALRPFWRSIYQALQDTPCQAAIVSTSQTPPGNLPDQAQTVAEIPAESQLVIHAGDPAVLLQALALGAPSLVLPQTAGQMLTTVQVQAQRLGKSTWQPGKLPPLPWSFSAGRLRRMIAELLADPLYRQACQEKQQEIERLNPPATAALEMERFIRFRKYVTTQL